MVQLSFPTTVSSTALEDFYILVDVALPYQTVSQIERNRRAIIEHATSAFKILPDELTGRIAAVRLFEFPADYDPRFSTVSSPLIDSLSTEIQSSIFYQSAFADPKAGFSAFDFASGQIQASSEFPDKEIATVLLFEPSESKARSLAALEQIFNRSLQFDENIVIIPAGWFFERAEDDPFFLPLIEAYLSGEQVVFPEPAESEMPPESNWPVFILIVIWVTFLLHFKYQPIYRAELPRYFLHHNFFVSDVGELRIRNGLLGVVVFAQHALISGLAIWIFTDSLISERGLSSFTHHFPGWVYPGLESLSLALMGGTAVLLSHFASIFWIHLPNRGISNLSQTIHLYHWPLHLNLLNVTVMIIFYLMDLSEIWIISSFVIFLLIWFLSFNLAAFDATRFLEKFRPLYLSLTAGLHLIIWIFILWVFRFIPFIYEPLEMAFRLP
jgi:hypothetical protein